MLIGWMLPTFASETEQATAHCGETVQISATPARGYAFVSWSDGNTDNPREIIMDSIDVNLTAIFEKVCPQYGALPVVTLYDWVMMLDADSLKRMGLNIAEEDVRWYQIVGDIDEWNSDENDDILIGTGYYFSSISNLTGTGNYYARAAAPVNEDDPEGECNPYIYSEVIHYASSSPNKVQSETPHARIVPNYALRGEKIQLEGLLPDEITRIRVYSPTGKMLEEYESEGHETFPLTAASVPGCYIVRISSESRGETMKYVVVD